MISKKMITFVVLLWLAVVNCPICLPGEDQAEESRSNIIRTTVDGILCETKDGIAIFATSEHLDHIDTMTPLPDESQAEKISLDFRNANLRDIFKIIQTKANTNIVLTKELIGVAEQVKFSDISWKRALVLLAGSMGFDVRQHNSIIFIGRTKILDQIIKLPLPTLPDPGKKISMNLRNSDLRDACKLIAIMNSRNIIFGKSVRGNIDVNFRDVPEAEAMAAITRANGVDCRHEDGFWLIAPNKDLERYKISDLSDPALKDLEQDVSLDFRDTDIRDVLKLIAQKTSRNIICEKSVRGNSSLSLREVPATKAIQVISGINGYETMYYKGIWVIADPMVLMKVRKNLDKTKLPDAGKPISLDFRDTDIVQVFKIIESKLNMPVVVSPTVRGNVSIRLTDVPIMEALAFTTWMSGYEISFEKDRVEIK